MPVTQERFTENEKAILKGARDNEFCDAFDEGAPWVFAVITESGLDSKVARGAIASLVQKGIVAISDYGSKKHPDDMVLAVTEQGLAAVDQTRF